MDWKNLVADETRIIPCHYTRGRAGSIKGVTIHHMAGNLSISDCYNIWCNNEASAHYAVQADGRIGQLVNDSDTAWACGNTWANNNTISIEHANNSSNPWTVHKKALDAGAHLTAAICSYYGLGEPQWMVNVFPHKHWSPTACPGELAGSQNAEYMRLAKKYYKELKGGSNYNGGSAKVNKQVPGPAVNKAGFYYRAHVSNLGWLDCVRDGQVAGTTGNGLQLEAFKITPPSGVTLNVHAHISNVGWKTYKGVKKGVSSGIGSSANDPIIGTTGKRQAIEAFAVDVVENTTGKKLYYRCHMSGVGWCGWIPAPYAVGTVGCSKAIEAIQFKMV